MAQLEQMFRKRGSRVGYLGELWPSRNRCFGKWGAVAQLEQIFRKRGSRVGYLEELWPIWNRCLGKGGELQSWEPFLIEIFLPLTISDPVGLFRPFCP